MTEIQHQAKLEYHRRYRAAHRDEINAYHRKWAKQHGEVVNSYQRKRRASNIEAARARDRKRRKKLYAASPEYRAKAVANTKRWAQKNPDRHHELARKVMKKIRDTHKTDPVWLERHRDYKRKRRAKKLGGAVGPIDYDMLLLDSCGLCGICGEQLDDKLHFDHIIPLARGGSHTQDNLQPAHAFCNLSKSAKLPEELARVS